MGFFSLTRRINTAIFTSIQLDVSSFHYNVQYAHGIPDYWDIIKSTSSTMSSFPIQGIAGSCFTRVVKNSRFVFAPVQL